MTEARIPYDVTAVSHDGQHVPLTAQTSYSMAHEIAKPRSMDARWAMIQIRLSATGEMIAVYVNGEECPHLVRN